MRRQSICPPKAGGLTKARHGAEVEELSAAESEQDHSRAGGGIQEEKNLGSWAGAEQGQV